MKKWNNAEIVDLSINETAHGWTGIYRDGGYLGDGQLSGHLTWKKPECPSQPTDPEPSNPVNGQS